MYHMAAEHYAYLNNACFTTPSIIVTSLASFLSFTSASHPVNAKNIALTVGFLGTLATILTALQSAYKYDVKAEMFRSAAAEYRLIQTRLNACTRKDGMDASDWASLWAEIEVRMTELLKRAPVFPARELVDLWSKQGKLSAKTESSATVPPWLVRYLQNLEDDGVQTEDDIRFIPDEMFEKWEQPFYAPHPGDPEHKSVYDPELGHATRYPKVVIAKLKEMRNRLASKHVRRKAEKSSTGSGFGGGGDSLALTLKATTVAALRRQALTSVSDLRHATDEILESVLDELIAQETSPMPVSWMKLEELIYDVKRYGRPLPRLRQCYNPPLNQNAQRRCTRVIQTSIEAQEKIGERALRNSKDQHGRSSPVMSNKAAKNLSAVKQAAAKNRGVKSR
mmetsp:Transcript_32871/g.65483  ORF Transcript_32871/g.65483 Transcript_32871/m.65483 type:complete len:394 (+) Transcript_32871:1-1182(+)